MDQIPAWFSGARINFAENLLWCRDKNKVAIISAGTELHIIHLIVLINLIFSLIM